MLILAVFFVGLIGAIIGYLSGVASVFTYPALLLLGFPPVIANTTNVFSNVGGGLGSTLSGLRYIRRITTYPRVPQYIISAIGGALGAVLLLGVSASVFEAVVPWLVLFAVLSVVLAPLATRAGWHVNVGTGVFLVLVFGVGIYSGYFGAASAVMYMAVAALFTPLTTREALLLKAPITTVANAVATVYYLVNGAVNVPAAVSMMVGGLVGGWIGPKIGHYFSDRTIRVFVLVCGLALFVWLLVR